MWRSQRSKVHRQECSGIQSKEGRLAKMVEVLEGEDQELALDSEVGRKSVLGSTEGVT